MALRNSPAFEKELNGPRRARQKKVAGGVIVLALIGGLSARALQVISEFPVQLTEGKKAKFLADYAAKSKQICEVSDKNSGNVDEKTKDTVKEDEEKQSPQQIRIDKTKEREEERKTVFWSAVDLEDHSYEWCKGAAQGETEYKGYLAVRREGMPFGEWRMVGVNNTSVTFEWHMFEESGNVWDKLASPIYSPEETVNFSDNTMVAAGATTPEK